MNAALQKIAAVVGFILFAVALTIGLLREVPVLAALYRALMIMIIGSVAVGLFFQFFAKILYQFIDEQRRQAEQATQAEAAQKKDKEAERSRVPLSK